MYDIIRKIETAYETANAGKSKCPIRVSSFGDCPAKLYQLIMGSNKEDLSGRAYRIFELGTQRGEAIANAIRAGLEPDGYKIETEVPIHVPILLPTGIAARLCEILSERYGSEDLPVRSEGDHLMVRGRSDCIAFDIDTVTHAKGEPQRVHIFEIKTKNSFGFDKLDAEGPGLQYLMQLYGYCLGMRHAGYNVASASFIFENKDSCELHQISLDSFPGIHDMWMSWNARFVQTLCQIATCTTFNMHGVDPMHITSSILEARSMGKSTVKLPWQCNYCPVGPLLCAKRAGDILLEPNVELADKRRSGSDKPAWMVTI
jgi:hypothetical protein